MALDPEAAELEIVGDEAYVTGRFTIADEAPSGARTASGRYVEVWRLAGGLWLLTHHTLLAEPAGTPR
jgi:ketosteroid isomerase-like protein